MPIDKWANWAKSGWGTPIGYCGVCGFQGTDAEVAEHREFAHHTESQPDARPNP